MNIEKKRMENWGTDRGGFIGHITLDKLAIPETVKVTLLGEPIIPESFDCYGHPNFTAEQKMLYIFKEEELKRQNGGEDISLKAEITYEELIFDVPRNTFDTVEGIEKSLLNLSDLNEMLKNRKLFLRAYGGEKLNVFMIFGCFWLDQSGEVLSVEKKKNRNLVSIYDVEDYKTIRKNNNNEGLIHLTSGFYDIPTPGLICPCCCKPFTINDIKNNSCVHVDGKFYHDICYRRYKKLTEVDKFTRRMVGLIYKDADYQFELIPNGYYLGDKDYSSYIPWILFHTIDGDIIIGTWGTTVILIEWQKNYKPFNMNELFGTEDVTKWEEEGKRGIKVKDKNKAYKYLKMVLDTVNPGYSEH